MVSNTVGHSFLLETPFHLSSRTHIALVLLQPEWSLTLWSPLGIPSHLTIMQLPRALSLKLNWSPYTPYPSWPLAKTECSTFKIYTKFRHFSLCSLPSPLSMISFLDYCKNLTGFADFTSFPHSLFSTKQAEITLKDISDHVTPLLKTVLKLRQRFYCGLQGTISFSFSWIPWPHAHYWWPHLLNPSDMTLLFVAWSTHIIDYLECSYCYSELSSSRYAHTHSLDPCLL